MKNWLLALLAFGSQIALGASAPEKPHPVYGVMKDFRTYFSLSNYRDFSQHLEAFFIDKDYVHVTLVGNSAKEILSLNKNQLNESWGLFGKPPGNPTPVPPQYSDLEKAAREVVQKYYPDAQNVVITYSGHFATVSLSELIPISDNPNLEKRLTVRSEGTFKIDDRMTTVAPYGFFMGEGFGRLAVCFGNFHCGQLPKFIDYRLPREFEGCSLLSSVAFKNPVDPVALYEWKKFQAVVLQTIRELQAGQYRNPIRRLLGEQGNTLLPPGYHQPARFSLVVYGRSNPQTAQDLKFVFDQEAAYQTPQTVTATAPSLGLSVQVTLSLRDMTASIEARDASGQVARTKATLSSTLFVEGGSVAIPGWISVQDQPGHNVELHLTANGAHPQIDIYDFGGLKSNLYVGAPPAQRH